MKSKKYTPQNLLARNDKGDIISVLDAQRIESLGKLSCPCCDKELRLRAKDSEYKQPHFAHMPGESCIDYQLTDHVERKDVFYKRELELTDAEVDNLKERVEGLEYIYSFIKRAKTDDITDDMKSEFFTAVSTLDYSDQIFVFDYSKQVSCLKSITKEFVDVINTNAISILNEKFPGLEIRNATTRDAKREDLYRGGQFGGCKYHYDRYDSGNGILNHCVWSEFQYYNHIVASSDVMRSKNSIYLNTNDFDSICIELEEFYHAKLTKDRYKEIRSIYEGECGWFNIDIFSFNPPYSNLTITLELEPCNSSQLFEYGNIPIISHPVCKFEIDNYLQMRFEDIEQKILENANACLQANGFPTLNSSDFNMFKNMERQNISGVDWSSLYFPSYCLKPSKKCPDHYVLRCSNNSDYYMIFVDDVNSIKSNDGKYVVLDANECYNVLWHYNDSSGNLCKAPCSKFGYEMFDVSMSMAPNSPSAKAWNEVRKNIVSAINFANDNDACKKIKHQSRINLVESELSSCAVSTMLDKSDIFDDEHRV